MDQGIIKKDSDIVGQCRLLKCTFENWRSNSEDANNRISKNLSN